MGLKLNLGAGALWSKSGWTIVDHNLKNRSSAWSIPLPDDSCSILYTCHMIEHIPHYKIEEVFCEINRVMETGGVLRILTPDLYKLAKAYVEHDTDFFLQVAAEHDSMKDDWGFGEAFMSFIVSPGLDHILFDKHLTEIIGGYGHLYCYDFDMLKILLKKFGFGNITRSEYCGSSIEELREPRHTDESKQGSSSRQWLTGFDRAPLVSLIIEATKQSNIDYANYQDANAESARNYNYYGLGPTRGLVNKLRVQCIALISKTLLLLQRIVRRS